MSNRIARAIKTIIEAASKYDLYLNNKNFLVIYKGDSGLEFSEVAFRDWHFKHLTGVKSSLNAGLFYSACLSGRLSESEIDSFSNGKTEYKLEVLPYLHELLYNTCMIGNYLNSGVLLRADYFIGSTRKTLNVGFVHQGNTDYPNTLYNGDIKKLTRPTLRVLAIFVKSTSERFYKETTFVAKGVDISEFHFPMIVQPESNVNNSAATSTQSDVVVDISDSSVESEKIIVPDVILKQLQTEISTSKNKSEELGQAEEMEEGKSKNNAEGEAIAFEKGKEQNTRDIVIRMINANIDDDTIYISTNVDYDQIYKIRKELAQEKASAMLTPPKPPVGYLKQNQEFADDQEDEMEQ